jgi:hypothetical protein
MLFSGAGAQSARAALFLVRLGWFVPASGKRETGESAACVVGAGA